MPLLKAQVAITELFFAPQPLLFAALVPQGASYVDKGSSLWTRCLPEQASPTLSNGARLDADYWSCRVCSKRDEQLAARTRYRNE